MSEKRFSWRTVGSVGSTGVIWSGGEDGLGVEALVGPGARFPGGGWGDLGCPPPACPLPLAADINETQEAFRGPAAPLPKCRHVIRCFVLTVHRF